MPTHERYVALLRGINVGRAKRVAMAELRALVSDLGYADVRTLLNSGNVVFSGKREVAPKVAAAIEAALLERTGVDSRVTVLTGGTLSDVVAANPLTAGLAEPSRYLVAFFREPSRARRTLAELEGQDWGREALAIGAHAAYLWCAEGILTSPMLAAVGKRMGEDVTTRNWATVTKLQALV